MRVWVIMFVCGGELWLVNDQHMVDEFHFPSSKMFRWSGANIKRAGQAPFKHLFIPFIVLI